MKLVFQMHLGGHSFMRRRRGREQPATDKHPVFSDWDGDSASQQRWTASHSANCYHGELVLQCRKCSRV
jgi:hypothetical protein